MPKEQLERIEMLASSHWLQKVDDWRAKQPGNPSRAEAIRGLVEHALEADLKRQSRRERMQAWDDDVARLDKAEKIKKVSIDLDEVEEKI